MVALFTVTGFCAEPHYVVVDTGQTKCYDNRNEIAPPKPGQPFCGQDAQHRDPKTGDPHSFPHGHGPQGDVIRIYNFVRLVHGQSAMSGRMLVMALRQLRSRASSSRLCTFPGDAGLFWLQQAGCATFLPSPSDSSRATTVKGGKGENMKHIDRITVNPKQCGGRPCIRGMRIRVKDVLDMLADGATEAEILESFPDLEAADIRACIAYAASYFDHPVLVTA